jgi:glycosyltransferase involved in cell wall biosynthesis
VTSAAAVRARARVDRRLAENRLASEAVGVALMLRSQLGPGSLQTRLASLATACRRISTPPLRWALRRLVQREIRGDRAAMWRDARVGWGRYYADFDIAQPELTTSLLLKEPGPSGEKGVLYVAFEYNWMRLLAHYDARALLSEYFLIGATSWSPTDFASFASFAGLSADPLWPGISNYADIAAYEMFQPVVRPLPLLASDWVNPEFYRPKPHHERDVDILMVANFSRFKRHWLLFKALREMPRSLRVTLVGIPAPGRSADDIREEARAFGVRQDLEILSNVNIDVVTDYQCRAKVAALFSKREGSCVATAEAMFADTPVAMMRDAHVGSKAYINSQTGVLLSESTVARGLAEFLEASSSFTPRSWAMQHITCQRSSARLNSILADYSTEAGLPWTRDITPLCWRYVPTYLDPDDEERMSDGVARLRADHGVVLKKFVYKPSSS